MQRLAVPKASVSELLGIFQYLTAENQAHTTNTSLLGQCSLELHHSCAVINFNLSVCPAAAFYSDLHSGGNTSLSLSPFSRVVTMKRGVKTDAQVEFYE